MIKSNFRPCGNIGPKGDNGETPHIGSNGNWFIGEKDTGIQAQGPRGQRGFRGETGAKGEKGEKGETGATGPAGPPTNVLEFEVGEDGHLYVEYQ